MKKIRNIATAFYAKAHVTAHRVEHPLHMSYLAAVFYNTSAIYGTIALVCAIAMLFAWEFRA